MDEKGLRRLADALSTCEVCERLPEYTRGTMPFTQYQVGYCLECLSRNAHPWWALTLTTATLGGRAHVSKEWQRMIEDTCLHFDRTLEEFDADVLVEMDALRAEREG